MSVTTSTIGRGFAPGSVVVVRDEEWLVTATEQTAGGLLIYGQGLSELVRDTTASFYDTLDDIEALDPAAVTVVADDSPRYRSARLWLESTYRKTAVPIGDRSLTASTRALPDALIYQQSAVRQALDPANLRPRILLADAVGLGKTLDEPQNILITPTAAEDAIAHDLERTWLFPPGGRSPYSGGGALFGWTLAKAFLSSPSALSETVTERRRRIRHHPNTGAEEIALQRLADLTTVALAAPSAMYAALVDYLKNIAVGRNSADRAVVFAERVATLRFLTKHLPAASACPPTALRSCTPA